MNRLFLLILFFTFFIQAKAQHIPTVKVLNEKIKLDGVFDEPAWQNAEKMPSFWQFFPKDSIKAKYQTEIMLCYDSKNVYIAAKMYSAGKKYVTPSFRRDFRAGGNDNVSFLFDTFNDKTNSFLFGINPYGVMREALLYNGGTANEYFNIYWDNKWEAVTKIYDDYWTCELAIPFSTLRFKDGNSQWNFKAYRFDTQSNEQSTLMRIPQNQIIMNLGYSMPIKFEQPLKKAGANISIIPYVSAGSTRDFEHPENPNAGNKLNFGGDAKVAVTSGLNLDLTFNPDFSNVEADRQVINLTRFDVNFPEQRQFFLENSDLFTGFGGYNTNPFVPPAGSLGVSAAGNQIVSPFFSRQIGIGIDTTTNLSVQNRITYGARISGKIDDNWRVGVLNTQTAADSYKGIASMNYSVAALQRRVFGRSNIAAIFVNKEVLGKELSKGVNAYNRVAGLEYNLASKDNRWNGKLYYHQVFSPISVNEKFAHGFSLNYSVRKLIAKWSHDWVGKGFDAEVGFVPRKNFFHINPTIGFNIFPKSRTFNRISYGVAYDQYSQPGLGVTDRQAGPFLLLGFQNSANILMTLNQNYTYLFNDFDALRSNRTLPSLKKGTSYTYYNFSANYVSDLRKKFSVNFQPLIGQYYDGSIVSMVGTASYRFQPYGFLSVNFSYNDIHLSTGSNKVYLFGPKFDLTFSKSLFWTSYVQYNSQIKNVNVNSRLQWRFAPVSDFFLVYTDNYNSEAWMPKNRAILAKVTYWLNL
ncbi:putative membrane associated hydrolase [Emticicia oligotrophica DSM 17448]|uniref:Membrane associated hydrolase n=1 Tax=Emticicia oligotrophica (strain DSM 17448 / CIP 109782 / MTCC 6937 / GPTSA100-15) TaxID=929562 RepID=A0ABM5MXC2_EMTOG|nr:MULTISPECIES: DUF5916 domain-containing protein [Emticicia]AFK01797.1 putative membrane associated hydrolase [Emticicia oligotrophica DSM 17448]